MPRKRLNGAQDMILLASTQLQAIYSLPVDPEAHTVYNDGNRGHTLNDVL